VIKQRWRGVRLFQTDKGFLWWIKAHSILKASTRAVRYETFYIGSSSFTCHQAWFIPVYPPNCRALPPTGWYSLLLSKEGWPGWDDTGDQLVGWCLTSHSTHYTSFRRRFYRPTDQTNSVKALKETSWSSRSGLNPTRTTPLCYNDTTLANRLYARRKGPNVTNPICWTCKNCSYKCAADCEHCVTQSSTEQFW